MDTALADQPSIRRIPLADRGGAMAALDFGPPNRSVDIVFAHANGFNARAYRTILAPLADELRILAVDQRGHGRTSLPTDTDGRASWDDLGEDLLALLTTLDLKDVVLSGHSMGGTASLLAAAGAPERVRSMVLFDPVILAPDAVRASRAGAMTESPLVAGALRRRAVFPSRQAVIEAYSGRGAFKTWTPDMLADYVADGFRDRPDGDVELTCSPAWEASNFTSHGHDPWSALLAGPAPICIFRAEHASTCAVEGHEAELAATGRIEVQTMSGTSHFLPMERPDLVAQALRTAAG